MDSGGVEQLPNSESQICWSQAGRLVAPRRPALNYQPGQSGEMQGNAGGFWPVCDVTSSVLSALRSNITILSAEEVRKTGYSASTQRF
ncbi:MAG: hypothetical protein CMJ47_10385 [Planctomyces sp.]|nr:hypothetical protein [Planctomyces sp.]